MVVVPCAGGKWLEVPHKEESRTLEIPHRGNPLQQSRVRGTCRIQLGSNEPTKSDKESEHFSDRIEMDPDMRHLSKTWRLGPHQCFGGQLFDARRFQNVSTLAFSRDGSGPERGPTILQPAHSPLSKPCQGGTPHKTSSRKANMFLVGWNLLCAAASVGCITRLKSQGMSIQT